MGVISTSITSLGIAIGLACAGLFAASEAGCASASGRAPGGRDDEHGERPRSR